MKNDLNLTDFLKDVFSSFDKKVENSGLVSICVEIPCIDLFQVYELLINQYPFSSFCEESDGISYIAFEMCKYVTLDGPKRFEVAKEFNSENFKNLINLTNESHNAALSKIIYLFSFSENLNNKNLPSDIPSLEAILPKILITQSDKNCWLRINGHVEGKSSLRTLIEEIWTIRNQVINSGSELIKSSGLKTSFDLPIIDDFLYSLETSNTSLKKVVNTGIQLVEKGILEKIVLANRIKIKFKNKLDLIKILKKLKKKPSEIIIDGPLLLRPWKGIQKNIVSGDSKFTAIASASIVAKVSRDNLMEKLEKQYPGYLLFKNKGYGTREHLTLIKKNGMSKLHRKSFLKKSNLI